MQVLRQLISSKKGVASIAGIVVVIANSFGLGLSEDAVLQILAVIGLYVAGVSIQDHGKEAAKIAKG
jgi:hypothetical protein